MDKQTEFEIRAQSTINTLKAQIADAMDGCVQLQAEIAYQKALVMERDSEIESLRGKLDGAQTGSSSGSA